MATDINAINTGLPINTIKTVCSTTRTGETATLLVRSNYPGTLTISSIETKFDNRFDDPSYYYGIGSGNLIGG